MTVDGDRVTPSRVKAFDMVSKWRAAGILHFGILRTVIGSTCDARYDLNRDGSALWFPGVTEPSDFYCRVVKVIRGITFSDEEMCESEVGSG